jgi:hypothetical protein
MSVLSEFLTKQIAFCVSPEEGLTLALNKNNNRADSKSLAFSLHLMPGTPFLINSLRFP